MVIISNDVLNVLNRVFLVGIGYEGKPPLLYAESMNQLEQLDKSITNVFASSVSNAPYAWKRDNVRVLVVRNLMLSYERLELEDGTINVVVHEVAENGVIVTESKRMVKRTNQIIRETIYDFIKRNTFQIR